MYPSVLGAPRGLWVGLWFRAQARSKMWVAYSWLSVGTCEMIHLSGAAVWYKTLEHEELGRGSLTTKVTQPDFLHLTFFRGR